MTPRCLPERKIHSWRVSIFKTIRLRPGWQEQKCKWCNLKRTVRPSGGVRSHTITAEYRGQDR